MKKLSFLFIIFFLLGNRLSFAQDTLNMHLLGVYSFQSLTAVAVKGSYAYVVENYNSPASIIVVDVSNPASPSWTDIKGLPDLLYYPKNVIMRGTHLFIGGVGPYFSVVDVSNPTTPEIVSGYEEYCNDAAFDGDFLLLAAGSNGMVILNIADLTNISETDWYEPSSHVLSIAIKDTMAFLACENGEIHIINIKDKNWTSRISSFTTPGTAKRIRISDNLAYVADGEQGLRIYDISDLGHITEVGAFVSDSLTNNVDFVHLQLMGSYVLVLDANFGLRLIDVSDLANVKQVAYYKLTLGTNFLAVGDLVYATEEKGMLVIKNRLLTGISQTEPLALDYRLSPNYPNPFNGTTVISFTLPREERVTISLFDVLGKEKALILDKVQAAGKHKVTFMANDLASGVYFYRMKTPHYTAVKKMVLIK